MSDSYPVADQNKPFPPDNWECSESFECDICQSYDVVFDLVYGLVHNRETYINHLRRKGKIQKIMDFEPRLNNLQFNYNCSKSFDREKKKKEIAEYARRTGNLLMSMKITNTFYSISKKYLEFNDFLLRFGIVNNTAGDDRKKLCRMCKFGLVFCDKIHFVLDGYDPIQLKSRMALSSKLKSITDCELIFINKYWQDLKTKVFFYFKGRKLSAPPWVKQDNFPINSQFINTFNVLQPPTSKLTQSCRFRSFRDIWELWKEREVLPENNCCQSYPLNVNNI